MSELTHAIPYQEDPTQDDEGVMIGDTQMSLDDQIAYAEFSLICAQSHLDELRAKKVSAQDAEDAHYDAQYQEYLEIEYGKLVMQSDAADKEIARDVALKYLEHHPDAHTKVVPTDGSFAFGDLVLVHGARQIGTISSEDNRQCPEVSDEIPF